MKSAKVTELYRKAAMKLYGISREKAVQAIKTPSEDTGEWAPKSMAVLHLEYEAMGALSYWDPYFFDRLNELSAEAGIGYIECINPAVCAVYE